MVSRGFRISFVVLVFLLIGGVFVEPLPKALAFSPQVIQKGATGNDVIELQARLQYIGYYKGKIDGVFGWGTYWALRNFQKKFALNVDGIAGANTKDKLVKASKYNKSYVQNQIRQGNDFTYYGNVPLSEQHKGTSNNTNSNTKQNTAPTKNKTTGQQATKTQTKGNLPSGYSANDIKLMTNAVYGESRGEPFKGQVAVAAVILNRVANPQFPNNVSGVIFQPGAFTAVADGQIWLSPDPEAKKAVIDAINGWDPSNGALYYFNPNTATSGWIWGRPQILKIGKHIFTR